VTQKGLEGVSSLFGQDLDPTQIQLQKTSKDFDGELTIVVFPFVRFSKKSPPETGNILGEYMLENCDEVIGFNVVKGFLNLVISEKYWLAFFNSILQNENFGLAPAKSKGQVMVEYSSPNTNKPLHLGHLRNNFLGYSVAKILEANGHDVLKVQIINDRGIHICKSMLAWQRFGNGETPESSGLKGDHLVGKYYVKFDKEYKAEIKQLSNAIAQSIPSLEGVGDLAGLNTKLLAQGKNGELSDLEKEQLKAIKTVLEQAAKQTPILKAAQEMLLKWEAKDPEVYALWEKMNSWVYAGFKDTYAEMGVSFDKLYYESNTYLKGKDEVEKGLEDNVFFKKEDGSVWCDLTADGMDEKLVLRGDGTAVYMTQDIGTAILRFQDFPDLTYQIYTVGNEQEYHFKVLFHILGKLGFEQAKDNFHLSYGMVELPSGKMKSREGTVVDADDLMEQMTKTAGDITTELGKLEGLAEEERQKLFKMIGHGALKYFLLRVDPKRNMLFDPSESVDFNGNTGPYLQFNYVRTRALLRGYTGDLPTELITDFTLSPTEKSLIMKLHDFPEIVIDAGAAFDPSVISSYCFELVKEYSSFYQSNPILKEEDVNRRDFRVALSAKMGNTLKIGMEMLGIEMPERM
ncbi:MAG: arginyl-tRNA synthetase, partial [Flavobacteriales bacterium]